MSLPNSPSFKAGGTINVGRVVKIDATADNQVIQVTAVSDTGIGIAKRSMRDTPGLTGSDNTVAALAGDSVEVYGPGSVCPAVASAAITRGAKLAATATGKVVTAAGAASNFQIGWALESASGADVEIQIYFHPMGILA